MSQKSQAWSTLRGHYWRDEYDGGPKPATIAELLAGLRSKKIAVIGASTVRLIWSACAQSEVTVIDFSPEMIEDLPSVITNNCELICSDVTGSLPLTDSFDAIVADRLLNRFTADELAAALRNIHRALQPTGEFRATVRFGLYRRDLPLVLWARKERALDGFYSARTGMIDYSRFGGPLERLLPTEGAIPPQLWYDHFRLRGPEQRLTPARLRRLALVPDGPFASVSPKHLHERDWMWVLRK